MKLKSLSYGVQVSNLYLQSCPVSDLKDLIEICVRERLVVLKHQNISIERFDEINDIFGIHQPYNTWANHAVFPKILRITNKYISKGKKGYWHDGDLLDWHTDGTFSYDPEDCSCLWCITLGINGSTEFACGVHAYKQLDDSVKEEIQSGKILITNKTERTYLKKRIIQVKLLPHEQKDFDKTTMRTRFFSGGAKENPYENQKLYDFDGQKLIKNKDIEKALVTKHPISKVTGLYLPLYFISKLKIKDKILSFDRSQKIFNLLVDSYVGNKGCFYKHDWEKGDMILSDQTHSLHRRLPFQGVRELYRTAFWYQAL